jgi:uncharacterized protein (DUF58 family)
LETIDLLKKVRKIEIKTKGLSNHIFSGEYHSKFKGRGMSFSEVREYQYGDDIRNIDWNVTARFQTPYIKVFEEERELTVMLLVDISQSTFIGTLNQTKREMIAELCAIIAFSAINNNDKVGLAFFSNKTELFLPPKKGKQQILRIIRELLNYNAENKTTDIAHTLEGFNNKMKKKAIVFILSDFLNDGYFEQLSHLAKKHDVIGIKINDTLDENIPNVGLMQIYDVEKQTHIWIDTNDKTWRTEYGKSYLKFQQYFEQSFGKSGADKLVLKSNQSYLSALINFFKKR